MESRSQSPGSQAGLSSPFACHRSSKAPAERSPQHRKTIWGPVCLAPTEGGCVGQKEVIFPFWDWGCKGTFWLLG